MKIAGSLIDVKILRVSLSSKVFGRLSPIAVDKTPIIMLFRPSTAL